MCEPRNEERFYDITGEWPGGISDGLTLACGVCGNFTKFDYTVTDELWEDVVPDKLKKGVVCLPCLDNLTKERGRRLSGHIVRVQYTGIDETIVLVPHTCFVYNSK